MPRTTSEPNILSKSGRARLATRREPHFRTLVRPDHQHGTPGLKLGFRKLATSRTWIAQLYDPATNRRRSHTLGKTDDDAGGLSYEAAAKAAEAWYRQELKACGDEREPAGPYTLRRAAEDYLEAYRRGATKGGGKALDRTEAALHAHILPALGDVDCAKLTKRRIETWHREIAERPPRRRSSDGLVRYAAADDSPEARRRRKSTANRVLTVLKAILNHAHQEGRIASDDAWRRVRPFREADAARVRYLSDDESRRLVNACPADFRALVVGALLTGARYGELVALEARDFDPDTGTLHIRRSKSGAPRHIALTDEGVAFFRRLTLDRRGDALVFRRDNGAAWGKSHQQRPLAAACAAARIDPPITFHGLRHTYASRLAMRGVPLAVIAQQLGHSDTRMVEKHYGHMAPSYVADTVRAAFGPMGLADGDNVAVLRPGAA